MPWPGSKIFLRIVQQLGGWYGLPDPFAAILPRTPPPPSQPRPSQATPKRRSGPLTPSNNLRIPFGCPSDTLRTPFGLVGWFLALAPNCL